LFNVPTGLVRILDCDLVLAGIARRFKVGGKWKIDKRDERGRTIDVHALRHSFATLLSKGGVAPRTAQAAMRHSSIDLTMTTYTDPKLLDVHGALDSLPALRLNAARQAELQLISAIGTDDSTGSQFAPKFAPTPDKSSKSWSFPDKTADGEPSRSERFAIVASGDAVKRNNPLTIAVSGLHPVERKGVEPSTSALRTQRSPN
jgi:Phage integrase family